jgi:hypothetical protein
VYAAAFKKRPDLPSALYKFRKRIDKKSAILHVSVTPPSRRNLNRPDM